MAITPDSEVNNTTIYLAAPNVIKKYTEIGGVTNVTDIYTDNVQHPIQGGVNIFTDIEIEANGTVWFAYREGLYKNVNDGSGAEVAVEEPLTVPPAALVAPQYAVNCPNITNPYLKMITLDINLQGHLVVLVKYFRASNCNQNGGITTQRINYLYRKLPNGTFSQGEEFIGDPWQNSFVLAPDNSDVIFFERGFSGGGRHVDWSTDFGATIENSPNMVTSENHVDVRTLVVYKQDPGAVTPSTIAPGYTVYVGTDGGISRLEDRLNQNGVLEKYWIDITGEGMANSNYYGLGITEQNGDFIFTGAQDGSINFYNDGNWFETAPGGDNGDCIINPTNFTQIIQMFQNSLRRTTLDASGDDTSGGTDIDPPPYINPNAQNPLTKEWIFPIYLNPNDPGELFAATTGLARLTNAWVNTNWDLLVPDGVRLSSIAIPERNNDLIFYTLNEYGNAGGIYKYDRAASSNPITDISNNLKTVYNLPAPISGIAIDPENEDRIWVSLARFADGRKVFKTENGGAHWENVSGCLPNIPVTAIVYQKDTEDRLYIGTDFGVFYKDANMADWAYYGNGGPGCMVADMDINYCDKKLVVATQGRGLWKVDLLDGKEQVLNANGGSIVWDTDRKLTSDLRIASGTTLEIIGGVEETVIGISEDVKIIIEPGATMIVDRSRLTSTCGKFWQGIRVWGKATNSQNAYPLQQGKLIVRNKSTIEYARNAVKLGKDGDWQQNYTGGIVQATDSKFRNNKRAVEFLKYQNFMPGNPGIISGNRSYFENCTFVTDESLPYG